MPPPAVSALARQTVRTAFEELERTIAPGESRDFSSTTLQHVRHEVLKIEDELAARQALRNMRRLAPLFNGLEHYAKVMDVLCNGTPFLPWAWAPITLILRVASEHLEAFDLIIKGYSKIAECLGRFAKLGDTFKANRDFQQTLAVFYADILEFHKHAYQFVRRSSEHSSTKRLPRLSLTNCGRLETVVSHIMASIPKALRQYLGEPKTTRGVD